MIRCMMRSEDGEVRSAQSVEQVQRMIQARGAPLWLDLSGESPESSEALLRQGFGFHPLAIDDALTESHVPKLDDWGDYLYIVLHAVSLKSAEGAELETEELDVFLGLNYLITHHDLAIDAVDQLWQRLERDPRRLESSAARLFYELLDLVVDAYLPVVDGMDDRLEGIEAKIFDRASPEVLQELFSFKRTLLDMRRIATPQREVLYKLARDAFPVLRPDDQVYFRDVYDHLVRMMGLTDSMRDQTASAMETYLSVINNRMNEIMKTLTVIATLFMPLTFLVGFFGMNFFQAVAPTPAWTSTSLLWAVIVSMLASLAAMVVWMRRRGWT